MGWAAQPGVPVLYSCKASSCTKCGLTAPREVLTVIAPSAISDGSLPHGGAAMLSQRVSLTKLEILQSSKRIVPEPF